MKRFSLAKGITFVLFCLVLNVAYAQQPTFQWAKHLRSNNATSTMLDMEVDKDKNVIVAGFFYDSLDVDPGPDTLKFYSAGAGDSFVAKFDSNGTLIWARHFGNIYEDRINGMGVDSSGNIYTGGYFRGTIDLDPGPAVLNFVNPSVQSSNSFLQKFDSNGNLVWAKVFGPNNGDDQLNEITVTPYGDVICAGVYQGTGDFDPGPGVFNMTFVGSIDAYLVRLDTNGDFIWAKSFGGTGGELTRSLEIDSAENIYFSGLYEDDGDFDPGPGVFTLPDYPGFSSFLVKLDGNGDFRWAKSYSTNGIEDAESDGLGNVYVVGSFENTCNFDLGGTNTSLTANSIFDDGFILKLDSLGGFVWVKHLDGNIGNDFNTAAAVDHENNLYVSGTFRQNATFDNTFVLTASSSGTGDAYLTKIDTSGTVEWVQIYGGSNFVYPLEVKIDKDNALYSCGYFTGTADFDPGASVATLSIVGNNFNSYIQKLAPPLDNDAGVTALQSPNCSGVLKCRLLSEILVEMT